MAVARVDSGVITTNSGASGPYTLNFSLTAGVSALYVAILCNNDVVTGATWNGTAMTQVTKATSSGTLYLFVLASPATGNKTLSVAYSGTQTIRGHYISYSGTAAANVAHESNTGTGTTFSLTTTIDNSWTVLFVGDTAHSGANLYTAGAGSTMVSNSDGAGNANGASLDSNGAITPVGSYSMSVTGAGTFEGIIASVAPPISSTTLETISTSEALTTTRGAVSIILDTLTFAEVVTGARGAVATVLDAIASADVVATAFRWLRQAMSTTVFNPTTKHSSSWSNEPKDTSTFTNIPKS